MDGVDRSLVMDVVSLSRRCRRVLGVDGPLVNDVVLLC